MASTTTKNTTSNKKIISIINPISAANFNTNNIEFGSLVINTELGTKKCNITYSNNNPSGKLLVVAKGCVVKSFSEALPYGSKEGDVIIKKEGKPNKYKIFLGLKDENFINLIIKALEESLILKGVEKSNEWFGEEMNEEECRDMFKTILSLHEKYGYAIGSDLSRDFTCKSKTEDVADTKDLFVALAKNNVVDVCFYITTVKVGVGKYSIGLEVSQINVITLGSKVEYQAKSVKPDEYIKGKITLSKIQPHPKGGKFIVPSYDGQKFHININDFVGRIFKFEKEGQVSYSLSFRLSESINRIMFENIEEELFNLLLANCKDIYDKKYTQKLLKTIVKPILSYNKQDQDKIKKGEKPSNPPSVYFKIPFYSAEKGFEGKVVNAVDNKPIINIDELLNKDLNIVNLKAYFKHLWIGPKGTSTSIPINKIAISFDVPEYNMDDIADALSSADEDEEANEEENEEANEEALNSDDE